MGPLEPVDAQTTVLAPISGSGAGAGAGARAGADLTTSPATPDRTRLAIGNPAGPAAANDGQRTGMAALSVGVAPARRPRVAVTLGIAALAASGLVIGLWPAGDDSRRAAAGSQTGVGRRAATDCEARYQTRTDTGRAVAAEVMVVNAGRPAGPNWTLRFDFPAEQAVTGGTGAVWTQHGRVVTARVTDPIQAGATTAMSFTGEYQGANPLPTTFLLDGAPCRATISGVIVAAAPAVPPTGDNTGAGNAGPGNPGTGDTGNAAGEKDPGKGGGKNRKGKGGGKD